MKTNNKQQFIETFQSSRYITSMGVLHAVTVQTKGTKLHFSMRINLKQKKVDKEHHSVSDIAQIPFIESKKVFF